MNNNSNKKKIPKCHLLTYAFYYIWGMIKKVRVLFSLSSSLPPHIWRTPACKAYLQA